MDKLLGPEKPVPFPQEFDNVEAYIESLLQFATSSWLLQTLCGGVHILDFYTRSPDLYSTILPQSWRHWFKHRDVMDILDLLMREDLDQVTKTVKNDDYIWRGGPPPPEDLMKYIKDVRKHLLARDLPRSSSTPRTERPAIPRHIATGMKVKKVHEVDNFARYIDNLTSQLVASGRKPITHLVDFGSGQNYLGRALAAPPYSKHIVAVESKQHNIEGAKNMDVLAKLVPKPLVMRNKKEYRARTGTGRKKKDTSSDVAKSHNEKVNGKIEHVETQIPDASLQRSRATSRIDPILREDIVSPNDNELKCLRYPPILPATLPLQHEGNIPPTYMSKNDVQNKTNGNHQIFVEGSGSVQYVEHIIKDGDLTPVIDQIINNPSADHETGNLNTSQTTSGSSDISGITKNVTAMVISLHSCGNLVHHGLRSLLHSPQISAVAMIGCCYNLVTERLGPPTYKLPTLRPNHPRSTESASTFDPHGFPMSHRLANYSLPYKPLAPDSPTTVKINAQEGPESPQEQPTGLRLNITARMMAVQAPFNWGPTDSDLFFTRHFYRALLQRIFLDRGIITAPIDSSVSHNSPAVSANGHSSHVAWTPPNGLGPGLSSNGIVTPLTIGTLRKFAYTDFVSYVRAAVAKLTTPNSFCTVDPAFVRERIDGLTNEEITQYERDYAERKKELSIIWSLMAFSAGVIESVIVCDRWLWLCEQKNVERAWVEPVFEYKHSPRNLVVVGIKK